MQARQKRTFVALLIAASLVAPGAALAADPAPNPEAKATDPAKTPAEAPAEAPAAAPDTTQNGGDAARYQVSREEAIRIARETLSIPSELGEGNVSISEDPQGATWNLEFRTSDEKPQYEGASVAIDAKTGTILNYNRYGNDPTKDPAPLSLTRAEAAEKAEEWLDLLASDIKDALQAVETTEIDYWGGPNASYSFRWVRTVEGHPVRDGGVTILIDARTGELTSYYSARRTTVAYTLPDTLLEEDAVEAAYRDQVKLGLRYQHFTKPGTNTGEWRLVYQPDLGFYPLMNQEGAILDHYGEVLDKENLPGIKVVPAADEPYQKPAQPLNREQALTLAREAAGQSGEPTGAFYSEYGDKAKTRVWEFTWNLTNESSKAQGNVNVRVDVDLGVVIGYSRWEDLATDQGAGTGIDREQAEQVAIEFLREFRPDLSGKLAIMPDLNSLYDVKGRLVEPQMFFVRMLPLREGIPVLGEDVSVDVDASGEIRSYWSNKSVFEEEFPSPDGVISPEEAMDAYLQHQKLELTWAQPWSRPTPEKNPEQADPILVWAPGQTLNSEFIDATNGAPLDYQGRNLTEVTQRPTDIDGHAAQREIELLLARGIFTVKDGKFNPDQAVTVEEAAQWLVMSRGIQPYVAFDFRSAFSGMGGVAASLEKSDNAPYFGAALQSGLLLPEDFADGLKPESPVSRELFALWAARAMGYGAIVRMANEIDMPFPDKESIGDKYANAVALLHGLKVISGDEATAFEPQRTLTRAEAAQILFQVSSQTRYY